MDESVGDKIKQAMEEIKNISPEFSEDWFSPEEGIEVTGPYKFTLPGEEGYEGYYHGQFQDGKRHGLGKCVTNEGSICYGFYKNDVPNGKFIRLRRNLNPKSEKDWHVEFYMGEMKEGLPDGAGKITYDDGQSYIGEYSHGRENGKGVKTYGDGNKYDGELKNGLFEGYGIFHWVNGKRYEGYWSQSKRHGKGVVYDPQNYPNLRFNCEFNMDAQVSIVKEEIAAEKPAEE